MTYSHRLRPFTDTAKLGTLRRLAVFPKHEVWSGRGEHNRRVHATRVTTDCDLTKASVRDDLLAIKEAKSQFIARVLSVEPNADPALGGSLTVVTERSIRRLSPTNIPRTWSSIHAVVSRALAAVADLHAVGVLHGGLCVGCFGWVEEANGACVQKLIRIRRRSLIADSAGEYAAVGRPPNPSPAQLLDEAHVTMHDDLFALGCMAIRISADDTIPGHLLQPTGWDGQPWVLPEVHPSCAVPGTFLNWLAKMVALNEADGFGSVRQALDALPSADWRPQEFARGHGRPPRATENRIPRPVATDTLDTSSLWAHAPEGGSPILESGGAWSNPRVGARPLV